MDDLLSTQEVGDLLGVSRVTVFRWIRTGKLSAKRAGRGYSVSLASAHMLAESLGKSSLSSTLVFDIGGTKIAGGRIEQGRIVDSVRFATAPERGYARVLDDITQAIHQLGYVHGMPIRLGIAGQVDASSGILISSPNLPADFQGATLISDLSMRLAGSTNIAMLNDAQCFALGEAYYGAGRGYESVFGMVVGTGIGGGFVVNGQLWGGRSHTAGEVGHMTVALDSAIPHTAGRRGHLEMLASGSSIRRHYAERTGQQVSAQDIARRADSGDSDARFVYMSASEALASGVASILYTLDPHIVVIGGGLSSEPRIREAFYARLPEKLRFSSLRETPVVFSELGSDAALLGASVIRGPDSA